jgi:hypothetical protein
MRLLLAGALATITAAGLVTIRPALVTDEERGAASAIRQNRLHADVRFLSSEALRGRSPATRDDRLTREYLATRFEAIGLEPGASGGGFEQDLEADGATAVIGRIRGRDPVLSAEVILYRARRDHAAPGLATMLAVAEAFVALPERPRRSICFAAVAAGEGLPGSPQLALHRPETGGRLAASLDVDGIDLRTGAHDLPANGPDKASLDGWVRAIAESQRLLAAPGLGAGRDVSDGVEDARLLFLLGAKVANAPQAPASGRGDDLDAARREALAELRR